MRWNSFRNGLQTVHLWAGLILCVPIVLIGLSGSALLVQREILAWSIPSASTAGERQSLVRMIEAAHVAVPADATPTRVEPPLRDGAPATIRFEGIATAPRGIDVYVDPVTLAVLGTSEVVQRGPILAALISVHAFLMMPPHIGLPFVGWMAVAMTFMGLSGIVLWWPRKGQWRRALWLSKGAKGLRFQRDLHHVAGFWGLLAFLTLSVSGIYLTFPESFRAGVAAVLPTGIDTGVPIPELARPAVFDADQALASAQEAVSDARAVLLQLPNRPGRPVVVEMETTRFGPGAPHILVTFDPETGELTYIDDPRAYSVGDKFVNLQHALHFAIGMGWIWEIVVFLSGLLPLLLAATGASIWWLRRRARRPVPAPAVRVPAE